MSRSKEKVWRLEPEECSHPLEELSHPRSAGTKKWFTCLACGLRWERVHETNTETEPAANLTAEQLSQARAELRRQGRVDLMEREPPIGRYPITTTANNPADVQTKDSALLGPVPAWKEKMFEQWLSTQRIAAPSTSSSSAIPRTEVTASTALPLLAAPETRKRTTDDPINFDMEIVLSPLAEKLRQKYLNLMTEEGMDHNNAVTWMLTNVPQEDPSAVKALQELFQYLASDV